MILHMLGFPNVSCNYVRRLGCKEQLCLAARGQHERRHMFWLVVLTILKNIHQWDGLSHILWKKHVWNHQPVFKSSIFANGKSPILFPKSDHHGGHWHLETYVMWQIAYIVMSQNWLISYIAMENQHFYYVCLVVDLPLWKIWKSVGIIIPNTLWLFNIAMENGPFTDGLPIKNGDFPWLCQITIWYMENQMLNFRRACQGSLLSLPRLWVWRRVLSSSEVSLAHGCGIAMTPWRSSKRKHTTRWCPHS